MWNEPSCAMAELWADGRPRRPIQLASLREDYLNQVQRDFLSRTSASRCPTPLANARRPWAGARADYASFPLALRSPFRRDAEQPVQLRACRRVEQRLGVSPEGASKS